MLIVKAIVRTKPIFFCLIVISLLLCDEVFANGHKYDISRDMGSCNTGPNNGKDCVTVSYEMGVASLEKAKFEIDQHLIIFQLIATKNQLGNMLLQYQSFSLKPNDIDGYKFKAIATYRLQAPELADKFVLLLREKGFKADILADLMKNYSCC